MEWLPTSVSSTTTGLIHPSPCAVKGLEVQHRGHEARY